MAASFTKLVPSSLNLVFKNVRPQRLVCSCKNRFVSNQNIKESLNAKSLSRCLSTSAKYWNKKQENDITEPVPQEDDEDELDVLYKKVIIEVKAHDRAVLKSYTQFVRLVSGHLGLNLRSVSSAPMYVHRQSVLKSVHIYKKHQVQYEERTYFEVYLFKHMTGSTADTFLEYIQRNLPEGVGMKVTKHRVEKFPEHIKPPTNQQEQIEHSTS